MGGLNNSWMQLILSIVLLAIAFTMFPIVLDGTAAITGHTHIDTFTGLANIANVGPLVIFVMLLFGSGVSALSGAKGLTGKGGGGSSRGSGDKVLMVVGLVMIAISFFVFPIIMDGCISILEHAGIATFTGLDDVVAVSPLVLYVVLLFGGSAMMGIGTIGKTRATGRVAKKAASYAYRR